MSPTARGSAETAGAAPTAVTSAVHAVRGALVAAARAGRTAGQGEVSSAAYGAWVPRGLPRLLAEVARACSERGEPDLTSLVAHPDQQDRAVAAERRACWQRWGGLPAPSSSSPPSGARGFGARGFGERGVVCPDCLVVVPARGGCRCCQRSAMS